MKLKIKGVQFLVTIFVIQVIGYEDQDFDDCQEPTTNFELVDYKADLLEVVRNIKIEIKRTEIKVWERSSEQIVKLRESRKKAVIEIQQNYRHYEFELHSIVNPYCRDNAKLEHLNEELAECSEGNLASLQAKENSVFQILKKIAKRYNPRYIWSLSYICKSTHPFITKFCARREVHEAREIQKEIMSDLQNIELEYALEMKSFENFGKSVKACQRDAVRKQKEKNTKILNQAKYCSLFTKQDQCSYKEGMKHGDTKKSVQTSKNVIQAEEEKPSKVNGTKPCQYPTDYQVEATAAGSKIVTDGDNSTTTGKPVETRKNVPENITTALNTSVSKMVRSNTKVVTPADVTDDNCTTTGRPVENTKNVPENITTAFNTSISETVSPVTEAVTTADVTNENSTTTGRPVETRKTTTEFNSPVTKTVRSNTEDATTAVIGDEQSAATTGRPVETRKTTTKFNSSVTKTVISNTEDETTAVIGDEERSATTGRPVETRKTASTFKSPVTKTVRSNTEDATTAVVRDKESNATTGRPVETTKTVPENITTAFNNSVTEAASPGSSIDDHTGVADDTAEVITAVVDNEDSSTTTAKPVTEAASPIRSNSNNKTTGLIDNSFSSNSTVINTTEPYQVSTGNQTITVTSAVIRDEIAATTGRPVETRKTAPKRLTTKFNSPVTKPVRSNTEDETTAVVRDEESDATTGRPVETTKTVPENITTAFNNSVTEAASSGSSIDDHTGEAEGIAEGKNTTTNAPQTPTPTQKPAWWKPIWNKIKSIGKKIKL